MSTWVEDVWLGFTQVSCECGSCYAITGFALTVS